MSTRKRPRITLAMIARGDETALLPPLDSARSVVDEMVVVDTGSSGRTARIARNLGAKVVEFPWRDDFAAARNFALEQVSGGWVLQLDAGERLEARTRRFIRAAVRHDDCHAWYLRVQDAVPGGRAAETPQLRLFRRTPEVRYAGRVFERVVPAPGGTSPGHSLARILRDPAGRDPARLAADAGLERRLLEIGLDETRDGGDPGLRGGYLLNWALRAADGERLNRLEELAPFTEENLGLEAYWMPAGLLHYANALSGVGCYREAGAAAQRSLERFGETPVLHVFAAQALLAEGDFEGAEREARTALDPNAAVSRGQFECSPPAEAVGGMARAVLASIRERLGRFEEAEQWYREALPAAPSLRPRLAYVQASLGHHAAALDTLEAKAPEPGISEDLSCLGFVLSLIVESPGGLLWWGERVREAAPRHPISALLIDRVESWTPGRRFEPADFPELNDLAAAPAPVSFSMR